MAFEIHLENPPAGFTLAAAKPNELVPVQFIEFTSSEDGQHFIQRLEKLTAGILAKLPTIIRPSQIDNLLVFFRRDGTATVYVNEPTRRIKVRASRSVQPGEPVTRDDIVDVDKVDLGVQVPEDAGFLYLFSVGWRKGLFYDFGPVGIPTPELRQYDVASALGQAYCHVMFQERFSISDDEWAALFEAKWFPFAGLRNELIDRLISYVRCGMAPDEMLDDVVSEVSGRLSQMLESWQNHSSFEPHIEILRHAIERFQSLDYVSCTGLLFPRIEGILRTHHTTLGITDRPSSTNLTSVAVASRIEKEKCLLMPHRFAAYLQNIYFANFNPDASEIDVSRHSVAHGVASASQFNRKSALLGILVTHQLFYFLENNGASDPANIDQSAR